MFHKNEQVEQIIFVTNNSLAIRDDLSEYYKSDKPTPNWFMGSHRSKRVLAGFFKSVFTMDKFDGQMYNN